ncbi:MAG: RNA methyltransferase [Bacteroides sp.]|nr:RNA methyltransferase [Bacteroides sp.]MCM1413791.1 RNA methyltransferase [Bacteroides sp.]MCM1472190.1 RNA methyltransferase [Bacteroides sp.]
MEKKTIRDLGRDTIDEYRARPKLPLTIVLDNVRSLNNIGSIFRTSDAFLVDRIMLCGITATPPSPEIHKTALDAEDSVSWQYFDSTISAVDSLHAEGYTICALEQVKGSVMLNEFSPNPDAKYAIIAGHEVHGVDPEVVNAADICLEIPQFGTKHSLNVSVSTGIAIWHFFTHLSTNQL